MKTILVALVLSFSTFAFADQLPVAWKLPNKGVGCSFLHAFDKGHKCGASRYELWSCPNAKGIERAYLVTGHYESDTVGSCSPTYVVKDVIEEEIF